jgi:outer membrane receptor for ferrienterochelin and colicins
MYANQFLILKTLTMKKYLLVLALLQFMFSEGTYAQQISGQIRGEESTGNKNQILPLINANLYWLETSKGTVTDFNGTFSLPIPEKGLPAKLIISYVGYKTDTIVVSNPNQLIAHTLKESKALGEVVVQDRQIGEYLSKQSAIQTQTITEAGLQKLPCCNLSESFENTAAVDVEYTDAVSGAKQIKMLGLDGKYSQILLEKKPYVRGLSSGLGLMFIPGTFIESIQISKGTSSVIEGFESITGQINVEYKKPENAEPFHLNLYGNHYGRFELNTYAAQRISKKWSTMLLGHYSFNRWKHDPDEDGFINLPLSEQIHVQNRWKYDNASNHEAVLGIDFLEETRDGGQTAFLNNPNDVSGTNYGIHIHNRKYEAFAKTGWLLSEFNEQSIGFIFTGTRHEMHALYGLRPFDGMQHSFYSNMIFSSALFSHEHKLNAGLSYMFDQYDQSFDGSDYSFAESIPGIFTEYTFTREEVVQAIFGLRYDITRNHGHFFTPRLHVKYHPSETTTLRLSAGKGYRVPNHIIENAAFFASSRQFLLEEDLKAEEATNIGFNFMQDFHIHAIERDLKVSFDYYRTDFMNQVIADADQEMNVLHIYNLNGKSYSNSLQLDLSMQPLERWDLSMAFRINDVKITIDDELRQKPFVNRYKALLTSSYATPENRWAFDFTLQFNGQSTLPQSIESLNLPYYEVNMTPSYFMAHAQITRKIKHFSIYLGAENLTNFVQKNPIISPENPFSDSFDTSMVWGPLMGRMFFLGFRYTLGGSN